MHDDKKKKGKRDDVKIDSKDRNEVNYAAKKASPPTTGEKVKNAIGKVGNSRTKVMAELNKKQNSDPVKVKPLAKQAKTNKK